MPTHAEAMSKTGRFEEIAIVHMDLVYRCALQMTKNESDAKDLVQETYFRADTNCKAWLFTILRNTFINTILSKRKRPQMIPLSEIDEHGIELSGADRVDCPVGTVMSRLSRGRRLLKKRLQDYAARRGFA
jgi:RNA polymerase sigma-70 factor (ECF subfamily)